MEYTQPTIKGRGAAADPPNRFERIEFAPDGDALDAGDVPAARPTVYLKDHSRSIITRHDSPDVMIEASINPYRGCEHGCAYCLSGETPILMADGSARPLADVRVGDEIYGTRREGWYRRYVTTRVLDHWRTVKPAFRVTLEDGTRLVASGDHRFLTERGWKFVAPGVGGQRPHLTTNNKLMGIGAVRAAPPEHGDEYVRGYLCGLVRGDGHIGFYRYERDGGGGGANWRFRLAMADDEPLDRATRYLGALGVSVRPFDFQQPTATRRGMRALRTQASADVTRIAGLVEIPDAQPVAWCRGFLAGIFDAEGSYLDGILRICNTDPRLIACLRDCLSRLRFQFVTEPRSASRDTPLDVVRVRGGLREHLRFFQETDPAIARKRDIAGQAVKSAAKLRVVAIEPLGGRRELFDITTGTGDFIADGVVSHNCFARPTHEYLGFSAGLDFESRIVVKTDAPELLRKELSSSRYAVEVLSISGVTDCYQPVERRLRLTRRCLQVLAEFRNPAGLITKNHLITRDADVLADLARDRLAVAILSVTTLDPALSRVMEPRASAPRDRLAAVEALARAGVPVGVMVAPVVPGLTDHEMPQILRAAADAGARFAGMVPLRLPWAVAPLFEDWLARHFPDRKDKVLNRVRSLRGGKLYDSAFGTRMTGEGVWADQLRTMFALARRKAGLDNPFPELAKDKFRRPGGSQMTLW